MLSFPLPLLFLFASSPQVASPCAPTPTAAAQLTVGDAGKISPPSTSIGFRALGLHWDPLLRKLWFRVVSCEHPERPTVLVPLDLQADAPPSMPSVFPQESKPQAIAVRAGQAVDLLYEKGAAKIHLRGVSEQNGAVGDEITLRPLSGLSSTPGLRLHASVTAQGQGVLLP